MSKLNSNLKTLKAIQKIVSDEQIGTMKQSTEHYYNGMNSLFAGFTVFVLV